MKSIAITGLCVLALGAHSALAQGLEKIDAHFEKKIEILRKKVLNEKFKALCKYVNSEKNTANADLTEAMLTAAELGESLGKIDEARVLADKALARASEGQMHTRASLIAGKCAIAAKAEPTLVKKILMPLIEEAVLEQASVDAAMQAATLLADYLITVSDKQGAVAAWEKIKEKLEHQGIRQHADSQIKSLELIGTTPPAFEVDDIVGKKLSLAQYKGKVVLLDFWATWCGPCVGELPNVLATYKKYKAAGFEIVGISLDKDREKLDAFLEKNHMTWRQFFDGKGWQNEVAKLFEIHSIPATYLLDREGKIAKVNLRGEALGKAVAALLGSK